MPPSNSVKDLLSSFGLGKFAAANAQAMAAGGGGGGRNGAAPGTGGMPNSNSMMQLLAALDSPTGRLTEGVAEAASGAEASSGLGGSLLSGSGLNSASVSSLRGMLRSFSSTGSLEGMSAANLGEGQLIDLQNFAALTRNTSLQNALGSMSNNSSFNFGSLGGAVAGATVRSPARHQLSHEHGAARERRPLVPHGQLHRLQAVLDRRVREVHRQRQMRIGCAAATRGATAGRLRCGRAAQEGAAAATLRVDDAPARRLVVGTPTTRGRRCVGGPNDGAAARVDAVGEQLLGRHHAAGCRLDRALLDEVVERVHVGDMWSALVAEVPRRALPWHVREQLRHTPPFARVTMKQRRHVPLEDGEVA